MLGLLRAVMYVRRPKPRSSAAFLTEEKAGGSWVGAFLRRPHDATVVCIVRLVMLTGSRLSRSKSKQPETRSFLGGKEEGAGRENRFRSMRSLMMIWRLRS